MDVEDIALLLTSLRNWRMASKKGGSMSPTVPPISVMTTSTSWLRATRAIRGLISLRHGNDLNGSPQSPRRLLRMTRCSRRNQR